jgi:His-Xaa-Ser repeat protein HxsA
MRQKFLVPSLLAAGFVASETDALAKAPDRKGNENKDGLFEQFRLGHKYNLAGHRSHASHGSHSSHRSSSGGGYRAPSTPAPTIRAPSASRNNSSTSPSSILPSPQANAATPLPGNSSKFKAIAMQVQTALLSYGYYNGAIDGIIGAGSKSALSRFQSDYGLKVTGTITPEVLNAFGITAN